MRGSAERIGSCHFRRAASNATSIKYINDSHSPRYIPKPVPKLATQVPAQQSSIFKMARLAFSLAAAAASLVSSVSAAATSGDFNVLTMNVAGLPAIFNGNDVPGDKTTNSRL